MKISSILAVASATSLTLVSAHAFCQAPAEERSGWSVGAGAGYYAGWYGLLPYEFVTPTSGLEAPVAGQVLAEKELTRSLRLVFQGGASYTEVDSDVYEAVQTGKNIGASVGARWVLNPGDLVEVSGLAMIGGYATEYSFRTVIDDDYEPRDSKLSTKKLGVTLGCAFEKELSDRLFLRFETPVVEAAFGRGRLTRDSLSGPRTKTKTDILSADLSFAPSVHLRFAL